VLWRQTSDRQRWQSGRNYGTGFQPGAVVNFGGVVISNSVLVNSTTINAITPVHVAGVVNITVINSDNKTCMLTGALPTRYLKQFYCLTISAVTQSIHQAG